jgi:hypothetical protein
MVRGMHMMIYMLMGGGSTFSWPQPQRPWPREPTTVKPRWRNFGSHGSRKRAWPRKTTKRGLARRVGGRWGRPFLLLFFFLFSYLPGIRLHARRRPNVIFIKQRGRWRHGRNKLGPPDIPSAPRKHDPGGNLPPFLPGASAVGHDHPTQFLGLILACRPTTDPIGCSLIEVGGCKTTNDRYYTPRLLLVVRIQPCRQPSIPVDGRRRLSAVRRMVASLLRSLDKGQSTNTSRDRITLVSWLDFCRILSCLTGIRYGLPQS